MAVVTAQAAGHVAALYEIGRDRGAEEAALQDDPSKAQSATALVLRRDKTDSRPAHAGQYSMMMLGFELGWAMRWVATPT
jgi:hypothetical protein